MDIEKTITKITRQQLPTEAEIIDICAQVQNILIREPVLLELKPPLIIVGDIHGQYFDLREIFRISPDLPTSQFLFLGDYVDRGLHGIETFLYLIAMKIRYPTRIFLLKGNHEDVYCTQVYGFKDEIIRKFGSIQIYNECIKTFHHLSIAAVINNQFFAVHGGISKLLRSLDQLRALQKRDTIEIQMKQSDNEFEADQEGLTEGEMNIIDMINDLMWSDPNDTINSYKASPRGSGHHFGTTAVNTFLEDNGLRMIIRSHQLKQDGYCIQLDNKCLTVWSAPNYCYRCGNEATILEIDEQLQFTIKMFKPSPENIHLGKGHNIIPEYFL